jgi:hypothetical protein
MHLSHDQALGIFTIGALALVFGGLQAATGRNMLSRTAFLAPSSRWVGFILAALGGIGLVLGAISLWLTS